MNIFIRKAKVEDAPTILNASKEIAQTPGYFCSLPSELTEQIVVDTVKKLSESWEGLYIVAELDGKIVGHPFLQALHLKSISHVAQLVIGVHQGWQEKGIGRLLLQHLIDWATQSQMIEKIELNVRASNTRAYTLYKKMGFTEEGRLKNRVKIDTGCYIDDILMALHVKIGVREHGR